MGRGFVLSTLTAAFLTGVLVASAAAQDENPTTPGAIPDPGSYQGSTELQHQSDQQDQQFRQQQAQPQPYYQPSYPQQSYGGPRAYGGAAPPGVDAHCYAEVPQIPSLAPLSDKVTLGPVQADQVYMFDIGAKPTPAEKVLLRKWLSARNYCRHLIYAQPAAHSAKFQYQELHWGGPATERLITRLINGELTYGQFNRLRAQNSIAAMNWWRTH